MFVLDNVNRNVPLLYCSSSDFLARALVKERRKFENDLLDGRFQLLRAVIAKLNERVARIYFKKVRLNQAKSSTETAFQNVKIDTEIDYIFELCGIPLAQGSQRLFIIKLHFSNSGLLRPKIP
jgi:hypothetical protein